ncbi:hypothetical protein M2451_003621 [Dysgonomonas sp. PFB1-18]|nr:hypothetical protein [Dysgonomonas sp. PFB1-18]
MIQPGRGHGRFNYYTVDLWKIRTEDKVEMTYPSIEIPDIDTLFTKIQNVKNTIPSDGDKVTMTSVKIKNMPLNIVAKLMCYMKENDICRRWIVDLRNDEFNMFLGDESFSPADLDEAEYDAYVQNLDAEKLKNVKFEEHRFSLVTYDTNFQHEAEIISGYQISASKVFQSEIDKFSLIIGDLKKEYQPDSLSYLSDCARKGIRIGFDKNIPMLQLLKIIDIASRNNLLYDCFYDRGYLNVYTRCNADELLSSPYNSMQ